MTPVRTHFEKLTTENNLLVV